MQRICIKILTCMVIALCLITTISSCMPVKASSGVEPYSYYVENFSFTGSCGISKQVSGTFMKVRVRATASNNNNETITLKVNITNRNTSKSYTFLSDGQYHTYSNIYLGLSGGSDVYFGFTGANPAIRINVDMIVES